MSYSLFSGEDAPPFKGLWKKGVLKNFIISISLFVSLSRFLFLPFCGGTVSTQHGLIFSVSQEKEKVRGSVS